MIDLIEFLFFVRIFPIRFGRPCSKFNFSVGYFRLIKFDFRSILFPVTLVQFQNAYGCSISHMVIVIYILLQFTLLSNYFSNTKNKSSQNGDFVQIVSLTSICISRAMVVQRSEP